MNEILKQKLCGDLSEYRSIPFWSWNNELDARELCRQIEDMKRAGTGGFIIHARTGLKEEYLGEKWFSLVNVCLKKAKSLGMQAWIYDENGWPSGFVGGKLLQNNDFRARFLELEKGEFDKKAFASFIKSGDGFTRVLKPTSKKGGVKTEYFNVYLRVSPANTDILNPAVTDAFIAETHEKYYARFSKSFGKELAGFFTDEPQYYRWATPYTPLLEQEFVLKGEDVRDGLIWLFNHGEGGYAFRQKYYEAINKLYVNNFYKKVYDWCESHGCKITGHSVEESCLYGQMYGGAAVMPTYEYEHIPAIDWLGRECGNEISPRQVASVAAQLGKKKILTETFACSGYDVTPKELKSVAEYQYFNGVNLTCQHLYPYSISGHGKIDYPPIFSPQSNWFEEFKSFNDYFARLGLLIGETEDYCDVAVIHPMREAWLEYVRAEDAESVAEIEKNFENLLLDFRRNGVTFQLIDEKILSEHGSVEGEKGEYLRVGNKRYDKIFIPKMRTLAKSTFELLKKYTGKLGISGDIAYLDGEKTSARLNSNYSVAQAAIDKKYKFCSEGGKIVLTARTGETDEFVFIKNLSRTESSVFSFKNEGFRVLNLDDLTETEFDCERDFELGAQESLILISSKGEKSVALRKKIFKETEVGSNFKISDISENFLTLDYVRVAKGDNHYGELKPIPEAFEELLRDDYKGVVRVRQEFYIENLLTLKLIMERAKFIAARLNGKALQFEQSSFDVGFIEADITRSLRLGKNVLSYSFDFWQHDGVHFALFDPLATESVKNCLYYDTSIEPVYLKGDFILGKNFEIKRREEFPPLTDKLYALGYPFFKGKLTLSGKLNYSGQGAAKLKFVGRFLAAKVSVGEKSAEVVLDNERDITHLLSVGENDVKIEVKSSLRNLLGPHHFAPIPEPLGVGPYHFDFRGDWQNGKPEAYTHEYNFVPFGIEKIIFKTEN